MLQTNQTNQQDDLHGSVSVMALPLCPPPPGFLVGFDDSWCDHDLCGYGLFCCFRNIFLFCFASALMIHLLVHFMMSDMEAWAIDCEQWHRLSMLQGKLARRPQ